MGIGELFESRSRIEIANCVYAQFTEMKSWPGGVELWFFDIALANQYGKFGPDSKNYYVSYRKEDCQNHPPAEVVDRVIAALLREIDFGRNIGLAESDRDPLMAEKETQAWT